MTQNNASAADAMKAIQDKISAFTIEEERKKEDKYCEVVFPAKDTRSWSGVLKDVLGAAAKVPKSNPTEEHSKITKEYGGIYPGQTLFAKEYADGMVIAMFWPWGDGVYTTLKVAVCK